jgi:hypothetical protein
MDDAAISEDMPPVALPPLLNSMTDTFTAPGQPNVIVSNVVPPDNPEQPPTADPIYPPVYYPGPPTIFGGNTAPIPPISSTPEPASLVLMTTAFGLMSGLVFWKRDQSTGLRRQATLS